MFGQNEHRHFTYMPPGKDFGEGFDPQSPAFFQATSLPWTIHGEYETINRTAPVWHKAHSHSECFGHPTWRHCGSSCGAACLTCARRPARKWRTGTASRLCVSGCGHPGAPSGRMQTSRSRTGRAVRRPYGCAPDPQSYGDIRAVPPRCLSPY